MTFILIYRLSPFSEWHRLTVARFAAADLLIRMVMSLGGQVCLSGHGKGLRALS